MTIPVDIEQWLKTSIAGIILLGAIGSLLAVLIGRFVFAMATFILPAPYRAYRKQSRKQAFLMGFAHATLNGDQTGRMILTLLCFRLARFIAALTLFIFAAIIVTNIFVFQAQVLLTIGVFIAVVLAFLALYWAYFEFEWLHRTYLWLWKKSLERGDKAYSVRQSLNENELAQQTSKRGEDN
ncbi:membrane protein implicated in regulation of membrane protease activity [Herbaspirillum rubrisubalbicans]|uniref:hypothetical protein n=1 Tax=Herbaspirillum rubrisubalbicans TaxID=80842 RepID=UPI00209CE705|nr:hypothetical protein [Herbaspirillum rubrisubalbicans]MCP1573605.1 membrane protein implicated in regulation of membrane protease activity [Herbaspirillum rubrisubalbicans]